MNRPSFDLRREPWIDCIDKDGQSVCVGLEELFLRAHELRRFYNDNPLAEAGMFRLFLALAHSIVQGPADRKGWKKHYEAGRFDANRVREYFNKWSDRFDLFHPDYPFLQVPGLHYLDSKSKEPLPPSNISELLSHRASGNNPTLSDHTLDNVHPTLAPAEATAALIEHYLFKAGGLYKKTTNLCGHQDSCKNGVMVNGMSAFLESTDPHKGSLFETILFNLLPLRRLHAFQDWGKPVWERPPLESFDCGENAYIPRGYLDYLTMRSRNILLVPDSRGNVSSIYYACGAKLDENIIQPFCPYSKNKDKFQPLNLSAEKALWRNADTLFHYVENEGFLLQPLRFAQSIDIEKECGLLIYGMINDKAKVHDGVRERLPIPHRILHDPHSAGLIEEMIRHTESAARKLVTAVDAFVTTLDHREHSNKKTEDQQTAIKEAKLRFYTRLKIPFYRHLKDLDRVDSDSWLQQWDEKVHREAIRDYQSVCRYFDQHKQTWYLAFVQGERKLYPKGSA